MSSTGMNNTRYPLSTVTQMFPAGIPSMVAAIPNQTLLDNVNALRLPNRPISLLQAIWKAKSSRIILPQEEFGSSGPREN